MEEVKNTADGREMEAKSVMSEKGLLKGKNHCGLALINIGSVRLWRSRLNILNKSL